MEDALFRSRPMQHGCLASPDRASSLSCNTVFSLLLYCRLEPASQQRALRTLIFKNSVSIFGLIFLKFVLGEMSPRSRIKIVLIRPATPLAPPRWPTFDVTAPLDEEYARRGHK